MKKYIFLMLFGLIAHSLHAQSPNVTISGTLPFLKEGDAVKIEIYKYPAFMTVREFVTYYSVTVKQHSFTITVPVTVKPEFIFLDFGKLDKDIRTLIIYNGDRVYLTEVNGKYEFSGKNSADYNACLKLDEIYSRRNAFYNFHDPANVSRNFYDADSTAIDGLDYLQLQKPNLASPVYKLLTANVLAHDLFKGSLAAYALTGDSLMPRNPADYGYIPNPALNRAVKRLEKDTDALYTQFFLGGMINQYFIDSCFFAGERFDVTRCYEYLKRNFSGVTRNALVTKLLYDKRASNPHLTETVEDALTFVNSPDFRRVLTRLISHLGKGSTAYDFSLTDEAGSKKQLSDFKNKVVLLDFWYTGCPSCAQTAPYLLKIEKSFEGKPVAFLSICIDKHKEQWLKSLRSGIYAGILSVNLYTEGLGQDHPVIRYYQITSFPGLLLVDKDGKLCDPIKDPRSDNGDDLRKAINKLL